MDFHLSEKIPQTILLILVTTLLYLSSIQIELFQFLELIIRIDRQQKYSSTLESCQNM